MVTHRTADDSSFIDQLIRTATRALQALRRIEQMDEWEPEMRPEDRRLLQARRLLGDTPRLPARTRSTE